MAAVARVMGVEAEAVMPVVVVEEVVAGAVALAAETVVGVVQPAQHSMYARRNQHCLCIAHQC